MTLMLLALLLTPAAAQAPGIAVQLLFDGKPLRTNAPPQFSCRDDIRTTWIGCAVTHESGTGAFRMEKPAPGTYTLHVEIDENGDNPARFPGDYDVFQQFTVTDDAPAVLNVDVLKLMRVTYPWDNNRNLDGMLSSPLSAKPVIETPQRSGARTVDMMFAWDAVAPDAEYGYVVRAVRESPFELGPDMLRGTTRTTSTTLLLPLSPPGYYFAFELSAQRDGRRIGEVFTHDAGSQGWTLNFVVREWSGRPTIAAAAPSAAGDVFLDEWKQAVPQPVWWDEVARPAQTIDSLGDLLSVWRSGVDDTPSRRRFYKQVYQAILDHPGDEHLVAEGIELMAVGADLEDRLALLKFGVAHFFSYRQRLDNCANCKVGDRTGAMVRDLADAYVSNGEPEPAIQIVQRLVTERGSDVSAYSLALTFETMSRAYWAMKDVEGAKAAIREGLRRFPNGWQADQLRRTLAGYEKNPTRGDDRPSGGTASA